MSELREHFGTSLRRAREDRALTLGDVAITTRVPRSSLELIESGDLVGLPADVFVRGFIRSYARAVGVDEVASVAGYDRARRAHADALRAESSLPVVDPAIAGLAAHDDVDEDASSSRRSMGLAVFVIILLLIATITLSLLLRRPPPSGEGLSLRDAEGATPLPRALPDPEA